MPFEYSIPRDRAELWIASIGDLNAQEFDSHYATVREALDSWIERFQSEADQAFEIPELEVRV